MIRMTFFTINDKSCKQNADPLSTKGEILKLLVKLLFERWMESSVHLHLTAIVVVMKSFWHLNVKNIHMNMLFLQDFHSLWSFWYSWFFLSMFWFDCGFMSKWCTKSIINPIYFAAYWENGNPCKFFPCIHFIVTSVFFPCLPFQHISCLLLYFHELCLLAKKWALWTISDGEGHHTLLLSCRNISSSLFLPFSVYLEWSF